MMHLRKIMLVNLVFLKINIVKLINVYNQRYTQ